MKLESVLKTSLDELRMQMLGSQVLFGFQYQGLFQDNFEALPAAGRTADAFASISITLALLPLAASICCDLWVALFKLAGSDTTSTVGALVTAAFLLGLWLVLPMALREKKHAR